MVHSVSEPGPRRPSKRKTRTSRKRRGLIIDGEHVPRLVARGLAWRAEVVMRDDAAIIRAPALNAKPQVSTWACEQVACERTTHSCCTELRKLQRYVRPSVPTNWRLSDLRVPNIVSVLHVDDVGRGECAPAKHGCLREVLGHRHRTRPAVQAELEAAECLVRAKAEDGHRSAP